MYHIPIIMAPFSVIRGRVQKKRFLLQVSAKLPICAIQFNVTKMHSHMPTKRVFPSSVCVPYRNCTRCNVSTIRFFEACMFKSYVICNVYAGLTLKVGLKAYRRREGHFIGKHIILVHLEKARHS